MPARLKKQVKILNTLSFIAHEGLCLWCYVATMQMHEFSVTFFSNTLRFLYILCMRFYTFPGLVLCYCHYIGARILLDMNLRNLLTFSCRASYARQENVMCLCLLIDCLLMLVNI